MKLLKRRLIIISGEVINLFVMIVKKMEDRTLMIIGISLFVAIIIFEVGSLGLMFLYSDDYECNYLWCTFTKTETNISENSECYMNGERIVCDEVKLKELDEKFKEIKEISSIRD